MNARHSKATPRWGTPSEYVEMARTALGGRIELDPMSEPTFNETIRAERIWTEQDDCFAGRCVWIGFSVEQLNLLADHPTHPMDFSFLLTRKRISFVRHDGYVGAPGHANYVVGIGIERDRFETAFGGRGRISHGRCAERRAA